LPVEDPGVVVGSEAGLRLPGEGGQDLLGAAAPVDRDPPDVEGGEALGVPGVGGSAPPALAGVAGIGVEGGGAEEVHRLPGATLGALDDQRNAKLILNVVLGGDALGYDLYRRRAAGGRSADVTPGG
jgi:hypothetical protein